MRRRRRCKSRVRCGSDRRAVAFDGADHHRRGVRNFRRWSANSPHPTKYLSSNGARPVKRTGAIFCRRSGGAGKREPPKAWWKVTSGQLLSCAQGLSLTTFSCGRRLLWMRDALTFSMSSSPIKGFLIILSSLTSPRVLLSTYPVTNKIGIAGYFNLGRARDFEAAHPGHCEIEQQRSTLGCRSRRSRAAPPLPALRTI